MYSFDKSSTSKLKNKTMSKKESKSKIMEKIKCTTERSKTTVNWYQFLQQQNKDPAVKKTVYNNMHSTNHKHKTHYPITKSAAPVDSKVVTTNIKSTKKFSTAVAIDCEMVGIGDGRENMLARVSLVDENGRCLYDTFVKAMEPVIDYRTGVSGVRPSDMRNGKEFKIVQQEVYQITNNKILVGHGINNDLKVLLLSHPRRHIRDTSKYKPLRELNKGGTPSLRTLAKLVLGKNIQDGEHSSIEDAWATMQIYLIHKHNWEHDVKLKHY